MAVSSVTSFILPPSFPNPTSSSSPTRQKLSLLSLLPSSSSTHGSISSSALNKPSSLFTNKVFAAPETLDEPSSSEEFSEVHTLFFPSVSPSRILRFVCIRQCSEHMCCRIITMSRKIKACPFMCVFSVCSGKVYSFFFVSVCDFQVPSSSSINVDADKVSSSSLLECSLCSSVKVVVFFWFTTSLHYLCLKCH